MVEFLNKQPVFHHLFRTQCLDDGAAYFGIRSHPNPNWGRDGNYDWAGDGRKLMEKVAKHGKHRFKVDVLQTDASREVLERRLNEILKETADHPLSLNVSPREHAERSGRPPGIPFSPEHKANLSKAEKGNQNAVGHVRPKLKWIHNPTTNEEMQIEVGETLLTGFMWGRLKKAKRADGPKPSPGANVAGLSDAERARLPEFMLNAARTKGGKGS